MPHMRNTFDHIVNGAVLAVCVILGISTSLQLHQYLQRQRAIRTVNIYQEGETLPALKDYRYVDADTTVLLAVRSTCQYCTASMPFYKTLTAAIEHASTNAKVVAVSTDTEDVLKRYFEANGVEAPLLRSVGADELRISGTPTILLADRSGVVRKVWIGLLNDEEQRDVVSAVLKQAKRSVS